MENNTQPITKEDIVCKIFNDMKSRHPGMKDYGIASLTLAVVVMGVYGSISKLNDTLEKQNANADQ